MSQRCPNLLIIGAMKSGTTSLHNYLNQHPDIFMTSNKEPNFFIKPRNEQETKEYLELFNCNEKYCGESTINYTKCHDFKEVPIRIKEINSNVKLIYIVRDPIARMISEFHHLKWRGDISSNLGINEYFSDFNNTAILTSSYYKQISEYLNYFSKEQILYLTLEELKSEPLKVLEKVANFLNIDSFPSNIRLEKHNVSKYKVKPKYLLGVINKKVLFLLNNKIGCKLKRSIKNIKLFQKVYYTAAYKDERLDSELKEKIKTHLREDIKKFSEISGIQYHL